MRRRKRQLCGCSKLHERLVQLSKAAMRAQSTGDQRVVWARWSTQHNGWQRVLFAGARSVAAVYLALVQHNDRIAQASFWLALLQGHCLGSKHLQHTGTSHPFFMSSHDREQLDILFITKRRGVASLRWHLSNSDQWQVAGTDFIWVFRMLCPWGVFSRGRL